jgi:hypothetical protein
VAEGTSKPRHTAETDEDSTKPVRTRGRDTLAADSTEAHTDRVAMVSRNKDGNADQSADYELLVDKDAPADEKRRAENRPPDSA